MTSCLKPALIFTFIFSLVGCGGGSSGSGGNSNPTPTTPTAPTASEIIINAKDYTANDLMSAAVSFLEQRYTGNTNTADIDLKLAHQVYYSLFVDSIVDIPDIALVDYLQQVDAGGNLDATYDCNFGGNATYKGKLTDSLLGNISIIYDSCDNLGRGSPINGNMAVNASELSDTTLDFTYYFDNLTWRVLGRSKKLSGYLRLETSVDFYLRTYDAIGEQNLLFVIDNQQQIQVNSQNQFTSQEPDELSNTSGDIFLHDAGKVAFEMEFTDGLPPYVRDGTMSFSEEKSVVFNFEDQYVRYLEDSNSDGELDIGTIINAADMLLSSLGERQLVALAEVSIPPIVNAPYLESIYDIYTTTPISVAEGYISDIDSSDEDLVITYRWYINDVAITGQTSRFLPSGIAVHSDSLEVTMIVSDGANTVESNRLRIRIEDSPAILSAQNVPKAIQLGDLVQFNLAVTDPDLQDTIVASTLLSGPEGVLVDEEGVVTWQVPDTATFPSQLYEFTFGVVDDNGPITTTLQLPLSLTVNSNQNFQIARSGIDIPEDDKSIHIGDFDGDQLNEVLSTNGINSVFLLENIGGEYQQKWVYPFKLPTSGKIKQVLSANVDEDPSMEILVVTDNGISLINGLDQMASVLVSSEFNLRFAAVADTDNDGVLELAYLYTESEYYNDINANIQVNVVAINSPTTSLFTTSLSNVKQIVFANVDSDNNLELITNNGRVYDAITWQNEWLNSSQFGDSLVTTGDYNGDGIDEIAGADSFGNLTVYSAVSKSQLDTFEDVKTCILTSANINENITDELIVGHCLSDKLSAYKLVNNKLESLWDLNTEIHGAISLAAGDSDNDGKLEIHWGDGRSFTSDGKFKVADVNVDSASLKENTSKIQLHNYSSAGWANLSDNDERAVFFIGNTGSGFNGARIATLESNGFFDLSSDVSARWPYEKSAVATDFNQDGVGDIFVPTSDSNDEILSVIQLSDESVHWKVEDSSNSTIGLIKAFDINGDGYEDLLYKDENTLNTLDIENQVILGNYSFEYSINDFSALTIGDQTAVLVASDDRLSYLVRTSSGFSELFFIDRSCHQLELINYDTDSQMEVACLRNNELFNLGQELIIYEFNEAGFIEAKRNTLNTIIIDIAVDPSTTQLQNLLVTTASGESYAFNGEPYTIKKMTTDGFGIWSSPALIGRPTNQGLKARLSDVGKLEIILSTKNMMYWIKE